MGQEGNNWSLVYDSFIPEQEGMREALCTLGNGYIAVRGSATESIADDIHYPGCYLAGGYNRLETEIAGRVVENEDLVNCPNWLPISYRIDGGEWFVLKAVALIDYHQELNIKEGTLQRKILFTDAHGRKTTLFERRFLHMRHYHLAAIEWSLTAENWSGEVEVRSALEGRVENLGGSKVPRLKPQTPYTYREW